MVRKRAATPAQDDVRLRRRAGAVPKTARAELRKIAAKIAAEELPQEYHGGDKGCAGKGAEVHDVCNCHGRTRTGRAPFRLRPAGCPGWA